MVKVGGDMMEGLTSRLCNMTFESLLMLDDWKSAETIPLYKGTEESTECKNY